MIDREWRRESKILRERKREGKRERERWGRGGERECTCVKFQRQREK